MLNLLLPALLAAPAPPVKPAINTQCPVIRRMKVDKTFPSVEVKGRLYRVCCTNCGKKLVSTPERFLEGDGSLRTKPKESSDPSSGHETHKH